MGLFDFLKSKKSVQVGTWLQDNPIFQQQKVLFDAMNAVCQDGCENTPDQSVKLKLTASRPDSGGGYGASESAR
jgi:hypothetical protein